MVTLISKSKCNLNGKYLEQMESFVSGISVHRRRQLKAFKRAAVGRLVLQSLSSICKSKNIFIPTKVTLLKALVSSVAVYGCKGWTLLSEDQKYIEAFKMRCYRRSLRISRTKHKTNEWINS